MRFEADHAGRVPVGEINTQFRNTGGTSAEYRAAAAAAMAHGWLILHPSGGCLTFIQAGANLFAFLGRNDSRFRDYSGGGRIVLVRNIGKNARCLVAFLGFACAENGWTPSIVRKGHDQNVYLVVDDLGRNGRVYRETDVEAADLETVILGLLEGEYNNPICVVAFNTFEGWSQDVSTDITQELRRPYPVQYCLVLRHTGPILGPRIARDRFVHRQLDPWR